MPVWHPAEIFLICLLKIQDPTILFAHPKSNQIKRHQIFYPICVDPIQANRSLS